MSESEPEPGEPGELPEPAESAESAESANPAASVERMFPYAVSGRLLLIGREALRSNKGRLHFVLIASDIIPAHREEVLRDLRHYPIVQHYTAAELARFFECPGAKSIGFMKSSLAQSIYAGLKQYRINKPPAGPTPPKGTKATKTSDE